MGKKKVLVYSDMKRHVSSNNLNKRLVKQAERTLWKRQMPSILPTKLHSIAVAHLLGDATLYKNKSGAYLKFEYSYKIKEYVEHLLSIWKDWSWYKSPRVYIPVKKGNHGQPHSYYFYTFSHLAFLSLWKQWYSKGRKTYPKGAILEYLDYEAFSYWIWDDGRLDKHKGYLTLHTENFSKKEVFQIVQELNQKFYLERKAMCKGRYWMIYIPK